MKCILAAFMSVGLVWCAWGAELDLTKSVVVLGKAVVGPDKATPLKYAGDILQQEIAARTGVKPDLVESLEKATGSVIVIATADALPSGMPKLPEGLAIPEKAEGYALWVDTATRPTATVCLIGRDGRGAIFAVGRLLRLLHMTTGSATLASDVRLATAPEYAMRGHHVGYDNMNNTYDTFTPEQFEQHCRDLFVFGTNAIELCPSLDPTEKNSPHMKRTMWDMNIEMSRIVGNYGMDLWMFVPILTDIAKPEIAEKALAERIALFKAMPHIDAVMVPGGDPGDTELPVLLPFLEKLAKELHAVHPKAGIWLSNQGFVKEKNDAFFDFLAKEQPDWLAGVVYGPWTKMSLRDVRDRTPKKYPIRFYPDFTHGLRCQYPIPEWDRAFAHTLGREPINPLPQAMTNIHNRLAPMTAGFVAYSEGAHDDVNKIIWSGLSWDTKTAPMDILKEYGRYYIGEVYGDAIASGLFALEQNWHGPLLTNKSVQTTFDQWRKLEESVDKKTLASNWRFQQGLFRAYYDEYVRRRLIQETAREDKCLAALANAKPNNISSAIAAARAALMQSDQDSQIAVLRTRLVQLGRDLFNNIGMQMDVANYKALNPERGAVLEYLDAPLNNKDWLNAQFQTILDAPPADAMKRIDTIVKWENPGPGGFYDDLGNAQKQPHLVRQVSASDDPGGIAGPMEEYCTVKGGRLSWEDQEHTLFGTPLRMKYDGLDKNAQYTLRVTYAGRFKATMRLVANAKTEIHGNVAQPNPVVPLEYTVPKEATADGTLELEWQLVEGRGCQVAEVWLLKQ